MPMVYGAVRPVNTAVTAVVQVALATSVRLVSANATAVNQLGVRQPATASSGNTPIVPMAVISAIAMPVCQMPSDAWVIKPKPVSLRLLAMIGMKVRLAPPVVSTVIATTVCLIRGCALVI